MNLLKIESVPEIYEYCSNKLQFCRDLIDLFIEYLGFHFVAWNKMTSSTVFLSKGTFSVVPNFVSSTWNIFTTPGNNCIQECNFVIDNLETSELKLSQVCLGILEVTSDGKAGSKAASGTNNSYNNSQDPSITMTRSFIPYKEFILAITTPESKMYITEGKGFMNSEGQCINTICSDHVKTSMYRKNTIDLKAIKKINFQFSRDPEKQRFQVNVRFENQIDDKIIEWTPLIMDDILDSWVTYLGLFV